MPARLIEMAHDAILVWEPDGTIVLWNRGAEELYGYTMAEALGRRSHDLLQTTFPVDLDAFLSAVGMNGEWRGELGHTTRDGRRVVVESRLARIDEPDHNLVLEINRDITERKRAEEEIRKLNGDLEARVARRTADLEELNAQLAAFTYSISHDLRAPLRAIHSLADALREDYDDRLDDVGRDYTRRISGSAHRLDEMIQDLLAYSRLGRAEMTLQRVDLDVVVDQSIAALRGAAGDEPCCFEVRGPLPPVIGHPSTLAQVVGNLLGNALKFHQPGEQPTVVIRAEPSGGRVRLWVEDSGIGIAPEHQERIFRVFERLHGIESYPGTGIGLAIVKKGVERMGGRVGLESSPGAGSRFWIELPAAEARS